MSQTYACKHCGKVMPTIFEVFLHIFTEHLHGDQQLTPQESARFLEGSRPYQHPMARECN